MDTLITGFSLKVFLITFAEESLSSALKRSSCINFAMVIISQKCVKLQVNEIVSKNLVGSKCLDDQGHSMDTPPPLRKFITSNLHCKITKNRSKPLPRKICTCEYKLKALNSCTWTCIYILLKLFHRYQIINLKTARAIRLLLYFTRYTLNINNNNAQRSTYIWYVNVNMQCTFLFFTRLTDDCV